MPREPEGYEGFSAAIKWVADNTDHLLFTGPRMELVRVDPNGHAFFLTRRDDGSCVWTRATRVH